MARSLGDIFGTDPQQPKTLDQIFAPPEVAPAPNLSMQGLREINNNIPDLPSNFSPTPAGYNSPLLPGEQPISPTSFAAPVLTPIRNFLTWAETPLRALNDIPFIKRGSEVGANVATLQNNPVTDTGSTAGNIGADILGNVAGFVANPGNEAANTGKSLFGLGENAVQKIAPAIAERIPALADKTLPNIFNTALGLAGGSTAYDVGNALANNEPLSAKDIATSAGVNAALGLLPYGIGKGLELKDNLKIAPDLKQAELATGNRLQAQNPLQDIQNAYQTPSLRDVKQQDYSNIFSGPEDTSFKPQTLKAENPSQYFGITQADVQAAFPPRDVNSYKFTTGEQRAMDELTQGMQTAQNYIKHNDVLAAYPPGTSVDAAYADIKANTGVDIPKLIDNLVQAQNAKTTLTPEELRMGKVAGVIPDLKPRDTLTPEPVTPTLEQPAQPNIFERKTWTNKDNIPSAGTAPIKSITPENVGQLPGGIKPGPGFGKASEITAEPKLQIAAANMEKPTAQPFKTPTLQSPVLGSQPETIPQIVSAFNKEKVSPSEVLQKVYNQTVNNTQGINRTVKGLDLTGAENPVVMTTVARNAGGTAGHIFNNGLVDMSGKQVINDSIASAFKVPKEQQQALDEYLFNLHNIDRMREGKPVFGNNVTAEDSKKIISDLNAKYPQLKDSANVIRQNLDGLLQEWGVKSGLVSQDLANKLQDMYKNYVPTYRSMSGAEGMLTKRRSTGAAKIINNAVGGNENLITPRESVPMLINKTVKAARKNEVYQGVLDAARKNPDNGFAKVLPTQGADETLINSVKNDGLEGIASNADKALTTDPKLGYLLTVMEHGQPVKLQVNKTLFDSLQALNKVDDSSLNKALQVVKKYATDPFKALITGYNPIFAVRNISRDIPTAYIQGTENNPLKFIGNLGSSAKDILTKSPRFQEFKALGGEGSNYFNVEKGGVPTPNIFKQAVGKVGKGISAVNNFTETLPRYGEYLGTLKRGGEGYSNKMQALHNAAEVTVNFGRHGDLVKSADAIVPYLNPAFQGVDKTARSLFNLKDIKGKTIPVPNPVNITKAIGAITVPTAGIYAINQMADKAGYDQLDNRTKDNYLLIPEKLWGGESGKFIKIPKAREAGVLFGSLFERIARQIQGQADAFKGFGNTAFTNIAPNSPIENNIFSPLTYNLPMNKDFAGRAIVPSYMTNDMRSPKLQYDEKTSQIAKTIGDKFNLSPMQIDYLIKSYSGIVGQIAQPLTSKNGQSLGSVLSRNFVSDSQYNNDILGNFYQKMDSLKQAATDKNLTQNIPSKVVTPEEKQYNAMLKTSKEISALKKQQLKATNSGDQQQANIFQGKVLDIARNATK